MKVRRQASIAFALIAVGALAGCDGAASGNSQIPNNGSGSVIVPTPDNTDAVVADGSQPAPERLRGPMTALLAELQGTDLSPAEQARREEERGRRQHELTAQCLAEFGFEYPAMPDDAQTVTVIDDWRPEDRNWVAQWGYSILNPPAIAHQAEPTGNPMRDYIGSLSEAEREAFYAALHGDVSPEELIARGIITAEGNILDEDAYWDSQGCSGRAWRQYSIETGLAVIESAEFAPLFEAWDEFERAFTAQRTDAEVDWAACMADAGFPDLERRGDAYRAIIDELDSLMGEAYAAFDPKTPMTPELRALANLEIDTALADLDCRVSVDYQNRQDALWYEAELQFVAEHQEAVTALRDALEQIG